MTPPAIRSSMSAMNGASQPRGSPAAGYHRVRASRKNCPPNTCRIGIIAGIGDPLCGAQPMEPRSPTKEELAAFRARANLREREERRRRDARKTRPLGNLGIRAGAAGGAGGRCAASLRTPGALQRTGKESRQGDAADIAGGLEGPRYADPAGRFSLVPPRHWVRVHPEAGSPFNVVFQGPYGMDMAIQVR